jgi:hypothetical protein
MNNKMKLLTSGVLLCIGGNAVAELYISPVVREPSSITVTNDRPVMQQQAPSIAQASVPFVPSSSVPSPAPLPAAPIVGSPATVPVVQKTFVPAPSPSKSNALFGKSVPLAIAAANLTPSKYWTVNIEEGLNDKLVSWENASGYVEAFSQIEKSGGINVTINAQETTVGIARTKSMADLLSKRSPNVYQIKSSLSLRKNLEAWAAKANWHVQYQEGLVADYDGLASATLTVPFEGEGGAVDQLLKGTWDKDVPLMGKFKTGNRTLLITIKGYERVNKLEPKY